MSLVNLAHACSHLQNASLARLGLTSIPFNKLHLSLALLLQKQGFLSQVKLGGPSPPASCFPPGARDNLAITAHPHGGAERSRHSPESALAQMVRNKLGKQQLQDRGFGQEAIEFAETHGMKSIEELEAEGWRTKILDFVSSAEAYISNEVEARRPEILESLNGMPESSPEYDAAFAHARIDASETFLSAHPIERQRLWHVLSKLSEEERQPHTFTPAMLRDMAGPELYKSERRISQEGIAIEAMGLSIPNQPIFLPDEQYTDENSLDAEGVVTQANRASRRLWLGLKYYNNAPVLSKARLISKPTKRIWLGSKDLARLVRGSRAGEVRPLVQIGEIIIVSTDRGLMEVRECVERRIGGQPLCRVW